MKSLSYYGERFGAGIDLLPYQTAFGLSLRWLGGPHARLYLGPLKFWMGLDL